MAATHTLTFLCKSLTTHPPSIPLPPHPRGSRFFQDADTDDRQSKPWFFSWTFAVSSVTIVSGCLAERTQLVAYPALTVGHV